jgi:tetratricopeptide (TPR) repeat protein
MGKDKVLDAANKEKVIGIQRSAFNCKAKKYFISCLLIAVSCQLFSFGCALPRIIVLEDPLTPEEHINLGVAYEKKGEFDNALKEYKEASKKLPVAYLYIGNVYFQKNDLDEAESAYKRALKKDPENADAHNNLAWLYYTKKENLDEAESLALKAIELNPSKRDIYQDTLEKIRELKR